MRLIETHSFSNLWYWVVLAVLLAFVGNRTLGASAGEVQSARSEGGARLDALILRIQQRARQVLEAYASHGTLLVAAWSFVVTALAILGFGFDFELAQAGLFLSLPLCLHFLLELVSARAVLVAMDEPSLWRILRRQRQVTQILGFALLFIAAFWGAARAISQMLI